MCLFIVSGLFTFRDKINVALTLTLHEVFFRSQESPSTNKWSFHSLISRHTPRMKTKIVVLSGNRAHIFPDANQAWWPHRPLHRPGNYTGNVVTWVESSPGPTFTCARKYLPIAAVSHEKDTRTSYTIHVTTGQQVSFSLPGKGLPGLTPMLNNAWVHKETIFFKYQTKCNS